MTNLTQNSLTVAFDYLLGDDGTRLDYKLRITGFQHPVLCNSPSRTCEVTGLSSGTWYGMALQACAKSMPTHCGSHSPPTSADTEKSKGKLYDNSVIGNRVSA